MEKINLNFFGEKVYIDTPKDLSILRSKISEIYLLSSSDVAEIILFYTKNSKKIYIINGNDFDNFKQSKVSTIFLDVDQNSKLYLDTASQLKNEIKKEEQKKENKEEIEKQEKEIAKLIAQKEENLKRQKEKYKLCEEKLAEIKKQKAQLEKIETELALECTVDMLELKEQNDEIDKKIEQIKRKGELKKEEELNLKFSKKIKYPYSQEDFKLNFKNPKALFKALNALKEKRMKERKILEEKSIPHKNINEYLDNHEKNKICIITNCSLCGSVQDIRRCVCNECICANCLKENEFVSHKDCISFMTGLNFTNKIYNVSKKPLPKNFECKITFISVGWIRVGITFEPKIADIDKDTNCPPFDIYCILEDLKQFYTYEKKWEWISSNKDLHLSKGDNMIMRFKNGELRYYINGEELENIFKIPLINKGDFYLFIQCRSEKSKAKIDYITEILD